MWDEGYLRAAQGLQRISQELIWASVLPVVERQAQALNEKAKTIAGRAERNPLDMDPSVRVPPYLTAVDIHCMPGNYHTEHTEDDISQGAVYERGAFLYNLGFLGPDNDAIGRLLAATVKEIYPDLAPRRILDLGCTSGHQTLPFCDAFPDAEVHAVDVAAPVLRYAQARSELFGHAVHWYQRDARHTDFPDGHFDLVVSVILLHETTAEAVPEVIRECHRLLAPGGVMAHLDIPDYNRFPDLLLQTILDSDRFHNNEPFWGGLHDLDLQQLCVDAGFAPEAVAKRVAPMHALQWMLLTARKAL